MEEGTKEKDPKKKDTKEKETEKDNDSSKEKDNDSSKENTIKEEKKDKNEKTAKEKDIEKPNDPYAGMTQRQIAAIKEEARLAEEKRREKIRFDNFYCFCFISYNIWYYSKY